jgi:hypothetical protein
MRRLRWHANPWRLANRVVNHALSASLIVDISIIYGLDTVSRPPRQRTVTLTSGHTHLFSMVTWYCGCRPPVFPVGDCLAEDQGSGSKEEDGSNLERVEAMAILIFVCGVIFWFWSDKILLKLISAIWNCSHLWFFENIYIRIEKAEKNLWFQQG